MNVLILGAGEIGFQLCKRLSQEKHNITIIDQNHQNVVRANEQLDAFVIEGHAASAKTLREGNIEKADIVAAMTNSDEVNLIACQIAKKIGVPTTIARVRNPELTDQQFVLSKEELGADLIIHPEKETAETVVRLIKRSSATSGNSSGEGFARFENSFERIGHPTG